MKNVVKEAIVQNNPAALSCFLQRPGNLTLPHNLTYANPKGSTQLSLRQQPHGHMVIYGPHGRRILLADPDGHPLHECEWVQTADGKIRFVSARIYLDWDQWVGIKPSGLVNTITMDLSARPGWQSLTSQDLRVMASRAMGVTLGEVEFFYTDEDLVIDPSGIARIQQRKDAFYMLHDGTFNHQQFLSCMSAMHWEAIDYLPVVELFKSLLPGTGSATFELIRGLYDDQNPNSPRTLQYRGIPTYPSEAAFGLFSNFFTPSYSGPESPFVVFMDTPRSHEVSWFPNADPPVRYVDSSHNACLTIRHGTVQKVTIPTDPTGLPYSAPNSQGFVPCAKTIALKENQLLLQDGLDTKTLRVNPIWNVASEQPANLASTITSAPNWRTLFSNGIPPVTPQEAFSAVLLYPEDDSPIEEYASQPFVADFLDDIFEQDDRLAQARDRATRVAIYGFDASLGTCLVLDQPRPHTLGFTHPALAQKQAQNLWNQLARSNRLDWLGLFRFFPAFDITSSEPSDWVYYWIPFSHYDQESSMKDHLQHISDMLASQGLAFVAGPQSIPSHAAKSSLHILFGESGSELQPFTMHRSILPNSKLNPHLYVWCLQKH